MFVAFGQSCHLRFSGMSFALQRPSQSTILNWIFLHLPRLTQAFPPPSFDQTHFRFSEQLYPQNFLSPHFPGSWARGHFASLLWQLGDLSWTLRAWCPLSFLLEMYHLGRCLLSESCYHPMSHSQFWNTLAVHFLATFLWRLPCLPL